MNNTPFFSIVITTLNSGESLSKTIASTLNQTFPNYEIIVKDGDSIDGSISSVPNDSRIRVVVKKDKSIYDGMNQACECISGLYTIFLNCGDYFHDEDVLKCIYSALVNESENDFILYGDVYNISKGTLILQNKNIDAYFWYRTTLCHQTVVIPTAILKRTPVYNVEYSISSDFDLLLYLYCSGCAFKRLEKCVVDYDGNGISASIAGKKRNKRERRAILSKYFGPFERICFFMRKVFDKIRGVKY